MIRILLTTVLPLLLPIAVYLGWLVVAGHVERRRAVEPTARRIPWTPLIAAGFVLMAATLVATAFTAGTAPWSEHRPPRVEDGQVVPGGVR